MRIVAVCSIAVCLGAGALPAALAQHQHDHDQHAPENQGHQMPPAPDQPAPLAHVEIGRVASGTAWQPGNTPHAAFHAQAAGWNLMLHGLLFGGYDWQGSDRGAASAVGVGWLMGMAQRRFETGAFMARTMLSPEFATVPGAGYPLLLQTGETYNNQPLRDRQHPHDLLMEAALLHTQQLGPSVALQVYAALPGEPALGPPGFPHRQSAIADPLAALAHHWQDSTHISFGVLTAGIVLRAAKLEASWFNGREPDETRHDVELRRPDSFAARLSINPKTELVAQVSYGYLASPETLRPDAEVHRVTASATYHRAAGAAGFWASTVVWGMNKEGHGKATQSALAETTLDLDARHTVFGRAEYVEKAGHDLVLTPALDEQTFRMGSLVVGYLHNFPEIARLRAGVGVRGAVNLISDGLEPFYGTRFPVGGMVYARLTVAPMMGMTGHVH